jgi:hypothetical protein
MYYHYLKDVEDSVVRAARILFAVLCITLLVSFVVPLSLALSGSIDTRGANGFAVGMGVLW